LSEISIRRPHSLPVDKARKLAEEMAVKLQQRFALEYAWRGHALEFNRDGVEGKLTVAADEIHLQARLGFLLSFLKPTIEQEIDANLEQLIADAGGKRTRNLA
jgi:putative polyhydroxyalkanoate system protein